MHNLHGSMPTEAIISSRRENCNDVKFNDFLISSTIAAYFGDSGSVYSFKISSVTFPPSNLLITRRVKGRVLQVFSNLIGNAFKFTKQGSVRYGYKKVGNMVEAYVSDTGMGIEESKLPYVFDRFVKANENVQGTGLGLSICKGIVEKLGGQVSVSSIVGEGSTFSFTLPYSEELEVSDSEEIL